MIGIRVSYKLIKDTPVAEDCKHLFARGYEEHEKLRKSTASFLIDKFRENATIFYNKQFNMNLVYNSNIFNKFPELKAYC